MKTSSLRFKLISLSIIIMFLSLIFIVYFVHSYFTKTVLAEKKNYNNYVVHDITYSISNIISNINNVSISIISDKAINTFCIRQKY